jgi:dTDP-4-amino-4,6-dideoxy-D-galactose acyltransferase
VKYLEGIANNMEMNKLFVFQKHEGCYLEELKKGLEIARKGSSFVFQIEVDDLSVDYLIDNKIDVIVSNGLSKEWYHVLKGLKIAAITIDELLKYHELADIVIDFRDSEGIKYFTGKHYTLLDNPDFETEFVEIVNLITKLHWDSEFWGLPVSYLSCSYLTESIIYRTEKFIKAESIKLIEYLCNCHDYRSVEIAANNAYHFADIRITFEKKLNGKVNVDLNSGITFSLSNSKDVKRLKEIAENLYKNSRYYFDQNFNKQKTNEFFQNWVEKAVVGQFDDECYCLYENKIPVGFCTVKYDISNSAKMSLVGLANEYQGKGYGKMLLNLTFNRLIDKGIESVFAVTQGRNYYAQRLYQKVGFTTKKTQIWYHKWV